jgi:hypothetical protein
MCLLFTRQVDFTFHSFECVVDVLFSVALMFELIL